MQSIETLSELDARRARARARASAGWLPLLLTGLALLGAFPAYAGWWDGSATECVCPAADSSLWDRLGLTGVGGGNRALALYWFGTVPAVYIASASWFARSARRTGLRQRWGVHLLMGTGTFAAVIALNVAPTGWLPPSSRPLITPLLALAVGLVALGIVEHDRVVTASGAAVAGLAVVAWALTRHVTSLPDSGLGNVGQALLAPSVEVAGLGLVLIAAAVLLRSVRRRAASSPAVALTPAAP